MPTTVLVTGVSRYLAARVARTVARHPEVHRVIGVDTLPPLRSTRPEPDSLEFVRADIRNPLIGKVIAGNDVDTVVHMNVAATPRGAGGRASMKEMNVLGTMQLLAACQRAPRLRRVVIKSTTAVYGASPRDPALFTEDTEPRSAPRTGYARDAVEIEGYARAFGRRRPDVTLTVLRFTNFIGPAMPSSLSTYFAMPLVPTVLGFDARLQLLHEDDAVAVLQRAAVGDRPGVFNVGGDGVLLLSQAIRRAGRLGVSVPSVAVSLVGRTMRGLGVVDVSPEQVRFLDYGRVVDTARLKTEFAYQPRYSTAAAFEDFLRGRPVRPVFDRDRFAWLESRLVDAAARLPRVGSAGG